MVTIKKLLLGVVSFSVSLSAMAVPAKPGLLKMTQPDGTELNVRLVGDEFHHYYLSEDGYYLVNDHDTFYYADVDAAGLTVRSDIKATPAARRSAEAKAYLSGVDMGRVNHTMQLAAQAGTSRMAQTVNIARPAFATGSGQMRATAGPGLFPGTHFPAMGKQKGLVILVEYKDVKMTLTDAHDYFSRMLNEPGFSDYGGTGSAVDFFRESSMGQFDPEFDVYGPVTLSRNRSYYGGNDWYGNDQHPAAMVTEALALLDATVDFSQYDRDGDGYVDNVFIFYAGRGEASGGSADTVWPHAWTVEAGEGYSPQHDGVYVSRYACSNEYESGRPDGVGTFIHEFSHVMGLPDLYATSYTSSFTPGSWSCMDYGPYNNDGCTPPLYGAFERYALGWMEPLEISGPVNATLEPISTNKAGIVRTSKANEFFLFENRQKTGWDAYIPGHGMLVWHVDYNESVWDSNKVNNTPSHQYVDIEEADGSQSEYSRDGDAFPGTSHKTSFTDTTNPSMKTWSGQSLGKPITDIAEAGGIITFKACGGSTEQLAPTVALEALDSDDSGFTAAWQPVEGGSYKLSVFTRPAEGDAVVYVPGYDHLPVGSVTSYRVDGLEGGSRYYYTVAVTNGWESSDDSNEIEVTTGPVPMSKMRPVALEPLSVGADGFIASWESLDNATGYLIDVYLKSLTGSNKDLCDFSDGASNLPAGWTSTTVTSYSNTAYTGQAAPSIRLGKTADAVVSAVYPEDIRYVKFWHRGNGSGEADRLAVSVHTASGWVTVEEVPVTTAAGGAITTVSVDVAGATQARVELRRNSGKGAVAVDDIEVGYGITYELLPVEGYVQLPVGNGTSFEVTGLDASTTYSYTITATDGTLLSIPSAPVEVVTAAGGTSAITDIETGAAVAVTVNGRTVTAGGVAITVYDLAGRMVGAGEAVTLPARGIYIVVTPAGAAKVRI